MKKNIITKVKKPNFIRQQSLRKKLEKKWRAPKGMHSKLRRKKKGKGPRPSIGYSFPKNLRGLKKGLKPVLIENLSQLKQLTKENGLILSRRLGEKKKIGILQKIRELNLTVINLKDVDDYIKKINEKMNQKKELKKNKQAKKKKAKEESVKKSEEKKKEETQEEKEKSEKEEKRKILEKK